MADNDHDASAAAAQKKKADHDSRFYATGIPEIPPLMHGILTEYSKIPEDEIVEHVVSLRDRAYAIYHYPCIGRYRFLTFSLLRHRLYATHVLPFLLSPAEPEPIFLDIGTCLGQDLRLLLYAGVPVPRVYGTDIEPQFLALGYDLFRDRARFPAGNQMAPVDLFDEGSFGKVVERFGGGVDVLHVAAVFHLFSLQDQRGIARRVLKLLRPAAAGAGRKSLLLGSQTAHAKGREYPQRVGGRGETLYRHSDVTWKKMWEEIAEEEGVKVEVGCVLHDSVQEEQNVKGIRTGVNDTAAGSPQDDPDFRWMEFEVWLLE